MVNFANFDLNLLRVLDALFREGSTVKAGERLGLSQSAVSSALTRLRHATGDALFVRHGNRLVPTSYAEALDQPLREQLEAIEQLLAAGDRFDPAVADGTFRISASDFFADMLMPALADRLRQRAPMVKAQLVDVVPYNYVENVERQKADLALVPDMNLPGWANTEKLFRSSFCAIARRGHPEISASGISPGQMIPLDLFCELGHVLFSPEGNLRAMGDAALEKIGRQRKVVLTLPVFSGVCSAVMGSDLIALVPRQLGEHMARKNLLHAYLPPMHVPAATIIGVWHKKSERSPFERWMRNQVFDLLRPLNAGEPDPL